MAYLEHHGILGQRWGIRRYQNKDGSLTNAGKERYSKDKPVDTDSDEYRAIKNISNAKTYNVDKWGSDQDNNVLYIIGTSGSGKSTTARGMARKNDSIIHLDTILEKENHGSPYYNADFDKFLRNKGVDLDAAQNPNIPKKERWKAIDAIGDQVEEYGRECYSKGKRVIIEGAQMGDDTMYPNKDYFNGKPVILLESNYDRDTRRAGLRDGLTMKDIEKDLGDTGREEWYKYIQSNMTKISEMNENTVKNGKNEVIKLLG